MKKGSRVVRILAVGSFAIACASPAFAQATRGFYLGVSAGEASFDLGSKAELDSVAVDSFQDQGVPVLSRASKVDESDTSLALIVGYRILPYVAVESSYIDFGTAKYRFNGTVNPPGPVTSAPAALGLDVESKGFTLSGIGCAPIGRFVDLHARIGFLIAQSKVSATASIGTAPPGADSDDLDSFSLLYGVGLGLNFGRHVELSLDWVRHDNVGDEDDDDDVDTEEGFDIDVASLTFRFKF